MQTNLKKEVSCKALEPLFNALNTKQLNENLLLNGVLYDIAYLKNNHERIEWSVWCKIISNIRPYLSNSEFEEMGTYIVKSGTYIIGMFFAYFLFSTNKFSKLINKQIFKLVGSTFSCIHQHTEYLDKNRIRITGYLDEGYEFCPEFWVISKGTWEQLALHIGHKGVIVNLTLTSNNAVFDVSWNKETLLFRIRRGIRWLFNIRKAFLELTESHQTLLNQYEQLDESKKLLQKQTTQLKTAYEISTSIRQSLNITDTLKAITDALVKEAGFSFASIKLFKDIEGNDIDIKSQGGEETNLVSPIRLEIVIIEKNIGQLNVLPKLDVDYRDCDELLEYLTPVINIAIHDALVLRAIVDYRDNLEQKVSDRTFELQKARDELTDTNELLKEAQQTQNRFFTNISHEFRTPLTLILGPAKQLSEQLNDGKSKEQLDLIHRSAKKLNRLVDELLDISKIESGEMKLKACPINLVSIVKDIVLSFHSLAERKKIAFKLCSDEEEIIAYIDKSKLDKILNNVLSNAFKFTPEGGKVEIEINCHPELTEGHPEFISGSALVSGFEPVSESMNEIKKLKQVQLDSHNLVEISIRDTGIGIPQNQIDKIFDRFYQVDGSHTREQEGTGIGLSLTKELIELHKGKIEVESEEGRGSIFRLIFPLGKDHLKPEDICEEEREKEKDHEQEQEKVVSELIEFTEVKERHKIEITLSEKPELPSLLIVEDNPDVRKYIRMILENQYRIFEAKDGEEGLAKSFECIPDLIISDIMMPGMDGFQMCSKLKTDSRTSHIPVIMLTAKATMKDKISGLETGADDYIMKPFEAEELKARIKNLLEQRKRLHEHFRRYGLVESAEGGEEKYITPCDQKFLQKAAAVINEHISDASFGVEMLADDMAVSRSLLLKKIEALLGEPPSEMIKRTRLNKAAKLIESKFGNISEIALEVGFNNPSYFAECFKKQFGVAPSQYKQNG